MHRFLATAATWWALLGGAILLLIVAVTSWNVGAFALARLGLPAKGLAGYEDAVRLMVSMSALMFLPYCQLQRGHVAVDLFVNALPARTRRGLDRLWLAVTAIAALFLGWWMSVGLVETRIDQTASRILGWPEWPFYAPGILSLMLWAAIAAEQAAGTDDGA
ncbi:MAG: TRAP transporter small permease [Pseudomonadota bacterium]